MKFIIKLSLAILSSISVTFIICLILGGGFGQTAGLIIFSLVSLCILPITFRGLSDKKKIPTPTRISIQPEDFTEPPMPMFDGKGDIFFYLAECVTIMDKGVNHRKCPNFMEWHQKYGKYFLEAGFYEKCKKYNERTLNNEPCLNCHIDNFVKIIKLEQIPGFDVTCEPVYKNLHARFGAFINSDKGKEFYQRIHNKLLLEKVTKEPQNFHELLD